MTSRARPRAPALHPQRDAAPAPPFPLAESKLVAPPARDGLITRDRLLRRLGDRPDCPVITVVAPAGYGKSTLLAQWASRRMPRASWITIDEHDNDPAVLLAYLTTALDRIETVDSAVFRPSGSAGAGIADVGRLVASIAAMKEPVALVLDQAEAITNRASRDVIAELAVRLPSGSQIAIGSRHDVPVPVARLRAERAIVEVGPPDLAMDRVEASELLERARVTLPAEAVDDLHQRTEGWAAGLYLAALASNAGSADAHSTFAFTGDDRFMGDYLRSEFLSNVSRADVNFLTHTSVLDRLSGPLCDAVIGRSGSERQLDRLERQNLLLVPLDRRREWYRYHRLFRELLNSELLRREPDVVADLHARAAAWYEHNGQLEAAIDHAQQANDAGTVARLVLLVANPVWASGRVDTVLRWMDWFATKGVVEQYPAIAVHGALIYALVGDAGGAERWAAAAERAPTADVALADGSTLAGSVAYLRTLLCREGIDAMRHDAGLALDGLGPTSPYRPAMLHAGGVAHLLQGDVDAADMLFTRALDEATSAGVVPFIPVLLVERGIVAARRDDWAAADDFADQALALMEDGRFDEYWTSALVFAWTASVSCRRGALGEAHDLVARAARLRPLLTHTLPIVSARALLELARAYVALGDPNGSRAVLRQLDELLRQRPHLVPIAREADDLRARVDALKTEILGASALTTAELRLLPLLSTHLSFAEIGERLFISRHTVKTQAISIYRKLGVSSRSETITRMEELGLVSRL